MVMIARQKYKVILKMSKEELTALKKTNAFKYIECRKKYLHSLQK